MMIFSMAACGGKEAPAEEPAEEAVVEEETGVMDVAGHKFVQESYTDGEKEVNEDNFMEISFGTDGTCSVTETFDGETFDPIPGTYTQDGENIAVTWKFAEEITQDAAMTFDGEKITYPLETRVEVDGNEEIIKSVAIFKLAD